MDRKQKKFKKSKKNVRVKTAIAWYKKHFLLEVLYYVPYIYITLFKFVGSLIWKSVLSVINWIKTHSILTAGVVKSNVLVLWSRIKIPQIGIPKIEFSRPKILNFDIKKLLISEFEGLMQELKDLFGLIKNIKIKFPKIKIPVIHIEIPKFKLPEIKLDLPKISLRPIAVKVAKTSKIEAKIKEPTKPQINVRFNTLQYLNRAVKSILAFTTNIIFWPFKTIYRILKAIFTFEIRFRLFSFRTFLIIAFIIGLYLGTAFYFIIWQDLPRIEALSTHEPRQTTTIYDRKGNILYRLYDDEDRTIVPLESIPRDFINATIAIEDEDFFTHNGLSIRGIIRAAKKTFFEDDIEGGSTITQQLVKNSLLTSERTYERKAKEAVIAIEVERKYSKKQILEMYLNRI